MEIALLIYWAGCMGFFFYCLVQEKPVILFLIWPIPLAKILWNALKEI